MTKKKVSVSKNKRNEGKTAVTAEEVIGALREARGYISKAGSLLGVTPQTVYNYRKRWRSVEEAWQTIREERHDFVENALHKQIAEGNITAIIFYLKTQARERGYVEQIDHAGKIDSDITIKFAWSDEDE